MIAKQSRDRTPILEQGVYMAACIMLIGLGQQYDEGYDRTSEQVKLIWEVEGQTVKIGEELLPRQISRDFTLSLDERSNLRKLLQSWRGQAFTAEELKGFELCNILGAWCQLQVIHKTSERGAYANVDNVMALPKGTKKPKVEKTTYFCLDDPATYGVYETLPRYLQEKIAKAENFAATGLVLPERKNGSAGAAVGEAPPVNYPGDDFDEITGGDDLPF